MEKCIICNGMCTEYTSQGLPVCKKHKGYSAMSLKCPVCQGSLDVRKGKWGVFFTCISCGVFSIAKLKRFSGLYFEKD